MRTITFSTEGIRWWCTAPVGYLMCSTGVPALAYFGSYLPAIADYKTARSAEVTEVINNIDHLYPRYWAEVVSR